MSDHEDIDGQEDFAALLAQSGAAPRLYAGQSVKGRIILIGAETVFVDIQGKGEALIDRAELQDEEGRLRVGVGCCAAPRRARPWKWRRAPACRWKAR